MCFETIHVAPLPRRGTYLRNMCSLTKGAANCLVANHICRTCVSHDSRNTPINCQFFNCQLPVCRTCTHVNLTFYDTADYAEDDTHGDCGSILLRSIVLFMLIMRIMPSMRSMTSMVIMLTMAVMFIMLRMVLMISMLTESPLSHLRVPCGSAPRSLRSLSTSGVDSGGGGVGVDSEGSRRDLEVDSEGTPSPRLSREQQLRYVRAATTQFAALPSRGNIYDRCVPRLSSAAHGLVTRDI